MIIVNADDFGRSRSETDVVMTCHAAGRITSTTAMVFMEDSERAARVARESGIDVGLHLNLSQRFSAPPAKKCIDEAHGQIVRFLTTSKYALLVYNPFLRRQFHDAIQAQVDEFCRLYGRAPSHIDGHQHQHLCTNVLIDGILPESQRVRRSFSFWPGEKGAVNRAYRAVVDQHLRRRYRLTDFFFSLKQCLESKQTTRVFELATTATVELMTHPLNPVEFAYLMGEDYRTALNLVAMSPCSVVA